MFDFLSFVGYLLLRRSPILIFILAVCIFAIVRWKRHPRVSLMTVLAFVIYLIDSFFFAFLYRFMPPGFFDLGRTNSGLNLIELLLQIAEDMVFVVVLVLLIVAAYTGRQPGTASGGPDNIDTNSKLDEVSLT